MDWLLGKDKKTRTQRLHSMRHKPPTPAQLKKLKEIGHGSPVIDRYVAYQIIRHGKAQVSADQ